MDVEHNFDWYRAKLLPGMLQYFNNLAISRQDYQTHLAIRFSRPQMKKAHRESLLNGGQFFKPDWHINSLRDLQILKRSKGMPELVEARRDNALQLYIPHDVGSVTNHFHRGPHLSAYKKDIEKSKYNNFSIRLTRVNINSSLTLHCKLQARHNLFNLYRLRYRLRWL